MRAPRLPPPPPPPPPPLGARHIAAVPPHSRLQACQRARGAGRHQWLPPGRSPASGLQHLVPLVAGGPHRWGRGAHPARLPGRLGRTTGWRHTRLPIRPRPPAGLAAANAAYALALLGLAAGIRRWRGAYVRHREVAMLGAQLLQAGMLLLTREARGGAGKQGVTGWGQEWLRRLACRVHAAASKYHPTIHRTPARLSTNPQSSTAAGARSSTAAPRCACWPRCWRVRASQSRTGSGPRQPTRLACSRSQPALPLPAGSRSPRAHPKPLSSCLPAALSSYLPYLPQGRRSSWASQHCMRACC